MPDDITLQLDQRSVTGKRVRYLRRDGIIPGNVYGRGLASVVVQAPLRELRRVFRGHDRNQVVNAQIAGEPGIRPVVLRDVQRHPVTHDVEHVDLYHIDITRPIHSAATVHVVGDEICPAIILGGVLVLGLGSVMLEALPMDMPSDFTIDISHLEHFGESVHVSDLDLPAGVRALAEPTAQLATIIAPRVAEEDEVAAEGLEEGVEGEDAPVDDAAADAADATD